MHTHAHKATTDMHWMWRDARVIIRYSTQLRVWCLAQGHLGSVSLQLTLCTVVCAGLEPALQTELLPPEE